ncbi:MAG: hypothetical protein GTO42_03375 [Candidatus Latescibacteria bacterium]|nr:hypothetical protein [Candidatus Latescibacterota bacterium]NIO01175.1 hypothetical protein [Candidatus Latescibacterota bacterium]NIO27560.1 hypothetical protein [Candidatus Latescibacterota bacterium]NIO78319.1 hypothetical protein [Candidatus Latescibacterota bacterium]NIT01191.1 hypothetical protein [Candidatus Latescibacterota bacterium]
MFIKDRLRAIFRTQLASGVLSVSGADAWLEDYPILATLSLEAYRSDRDEAFLQHAYSSIARYFNYLFIEQDADGDFLIESPDWNGAGRSQERVAFNALLAMDMENLSRICLQLKVPLRGLLWHEGARMIRERLTTACYDADANIFFSLEPLTNEKRWRDGPFLLLPTLFPDGIGENFASSMLRQFLTNPNTTRANPTDGSGGDGSAPFGESNIKTKHLLESCLVPEILERNGLVSEAANFRKKSMPQPGSTPLEQSSTRPSGAAVYEDYLTCRLAQSNGEHLFPPLLPLELFSRIAIAKYILRGEEGTSLMQSINEILHYVCMSRSPAESASNYRTIDDKTALAAVRQVYQSISIVKERRKRGAIFTPRDRTDIPGFDLDGAFTRLIQDVISALHRVESTIFHSQGNEKGFRLSSHLLKERTVIGETITLRLNISVNRAPEAIRSVLLSREALVDTLFHSNLPAELRPGGEPITLFHRFSVPSDWMPGIHTVPFSVTVRLGTGERRRLYFRKSIYLDPPVAFQVTFPEGRTLKDWGVPLDVQINKKAPYPVVIQTGWYSPSGLKLKEGKSQEIYMPELQNSVSTKLHVLAPSPIRPGAFPFVFKIFANGLDLGTISSTLFKHYQWIFVGSFATEGDPLLQVYPPERGVNLFAVFDGIDSRIFWRMLPPEALSDNGEINLGDLLAPNGVGFLYTVIKSTRPMSCSAFLSGNVPSGLLINGRLVLGSNPNSSPGQSQCTIQLKEGLNDVLVKVVGGEGARIFLNLGDEESLTSDEFNNNLWELVDGFKDFYEKRIRQFAESSSTQKLATLRFFDQEANSVSVIGTFNGWSAESSQLKEISNGVWEISLHLPPGKYAYRFLVNNRTQVLDPRCPVQEPDGFGGMNSVLYVE